MTTMQHIDEFFAYARERYSILLKRRAGKGRPWTKDEVLRDYRFCNVFREDDRTTIWFKDNVREHLKDLPEVLLATVVFRTFNRIEVGDAIFNQTELIGRAPPFDTFRNCGDWKVLRRGIAAWCNGGPYMTNAYKKPSPPGYKQLEGLCRVLGKFTNSGWLDCAEICLNGPRPQSLEEVWNFLKEEWYIREFQAYEVVTDLRHTRLLQRARDTNTWAYPGAGARRALNRIYGTPLDHKESTRQIIIEMVEILHRSYHKEYWPKGDWPDWELREVVHTLTEWDKYEAIRNSEGYRGRPYP